MTLKVESVYVAASSADIERAQHWTQQLGFAGLKVTSTWIESIADAGGVSNPRNASRDQRRGYSQKNVDAILEAQLLWILVPQPPKTTCGAWWEAGFAHGQRRVVVASGVDTEQSVFNSFAHEFKDDLVAFANICRFARDGAWIP